MILLHFNENVKGLLKMAKAQHTDLQLTVQIFHDYAIVYKSSSSWHDALTVNVKHWPYKYILYTDYLLL